MKKETVRSLYNRIYKRYEKNRGKASNDVTEFPAVLELLGNIRRKAILDMGCGLGKHAKEFINRGAIVTGFDASEKMVKITKEYCEGKGTFFKANYERVSFKPRTFDIVNASFSLNYSNKLERVFENVQTWLKPVGVFTFSIPHPVWLFQRVKNMDYSKPHQIRFKISSYDIELFNYYHPLDKYIQLINKNKFKLLNLVETTIPKKYKGWPEEKYRLPNSLVFKLKK